MAKHHKIFFGLFMILSCLLSKHAKAADMDEKLVAEFFTALSDFSQKHALEDTEVENLLGYVVLNGQKFRKGGIGLIEGKTYIDLDLKRNTIFLDGHKWEGKESSAPEVVLTDGHRVLSSVDKVDISNLKIIIFSPTEVRYINLTNNTGGKYLRYLEKKP